MSILLEGIPFMIGGAMISSAMSLCSRSAKGVEPTGSLYNFLSVDASSKYKSSFVAGILFAASLVASIYGFDEVENTHVKPFEAEKLFFKGTGLIQFMISGFLIGLGSKFAGGSISNFSFYGIPRFNSQSLIAMGVAMVFAAVTATLRSNFPILQGINISKKFNEHLDFRLSLLIPAIMIGFNLVKNYKDPVALRDIAKSFGIGNLLAVGMMMAGLARRHQMLDFLSLNERWNPFLIFVLAGAFLGNLLMFNVFGMSSTPSLEGVSILPAGPRMLIGCGLFGAGLGMSGLTPGAGLLVSAVYLPQILLFFLPFIVLGQVVGSVAAGSTPKVMLKTS